MSYREPPIDTVMRYLARAADVARKRRVHRYVRWSINEAVKDCFNEIVRQRKAGRRK